MRIAKELDKTIDNRTLADAEQCDRDMQELAYFETCDAIENYAKLLVPNTISKKEWNLICTKYSYPYSEK